MRRYSPAWPIRTDAAGALPAGSAVDELVATLPAGTGHWNSPIAVDGRIALPEGNSNDHATSAVLDIYRS